jgi:hypothetical protein
LIETNDAGCHRSRFQAIEGRFAREVLNFP